MIWDTLIWRLECSNRSKIRSAQKCNPCLRYELSPMSPGRTGLEAVVADGFEPPIDKACGEGLLPATLQALKRLDVHLDSFEGYPFHGIRFADHQSSVEASFNGLRALGVRRTTLHARLLESAQSRGVQFF